MKNITRIALAVLVLASITWACRKIDIGYLSDYIKYQNPVLYLMPGTNVTTGPLMEDGSTMPLQVEVLEIRNAGTGKVATDLLTPRPVRVWKALYNYKTDTTAALVNAKLETADKPAFEINKISGQMKWNPNTMFAEGTKYEFDLQISNIKGSKTYKNIGLVEMLPLKPVEFRGDTRLQIKELPGNATVYSKFEPQAKVLDGTSQVQFITKISDAGAPGIIVHFKVVDKNGVPFSPAAREIKGNWPGNNLPDYSDSSVDTEILADKFIYKFPVLPFPFPGSLWYNAGGHQYYHIVDSAVGVIDSAVLTKPYDPNKKYWLDLRFQTFINMPGTWEYKIVYTMVTHR